MLTSFSLTIPSITDTLRTRGRHFVDSPLGVNFSNHTNLLLGKSDADNLHHYFYKDSIKNVYDGLQANRSSDIANRSDRFKPVSGRNATNTPFSTSNAPQNVIAHGASGGANITQSSRLSDQKYDEWRKHVVNLRSQGYMANRTSQPMPPQITPNMNSILNNPKDAEKNQLDLLLTGIEERVFSGIVDNNVFKDLADYARGLEQVIYTFDDAQDLTDLINRLQSLETSVEGIASRRGTLGTSTKEANLGEASLALLSRIITFIEQNMSGVGRNESTRQFLQKANHQYLTKVGDPRKVPILGVLTKAEVDAKIASGEWSKAILKAMETPQLLEVLKNLGGKLGQAPNLYVSPEALRKAAKSRVQAELNDGYGINFKL
jgi:hypothetical protein